MRGRGPKFLTDAIQWRMERQAVVNMLEELDDDEVESVASIVKAILRRKHPEPPPEDDRNVGHS